MWNDAMRAWVFEDGGIITQELFESRPRSDRRRAEAAVGISAFIYAAARWFTPPNGYGYCPTCASWVGHGTSIAAAYRPEVPDVR